MHFFFLWTRDLLVSQKNDANTLFFHPPSHFHGDFCNCNSISICTASQFWVQLPLLYTAWSNAYSEISLEVMLRLLAQKIINGIHLCKPSSLNRPIRESALKVAWEKNPYAAPGNWTHISIAPEFLVQHSTGWATSESGGARMSSYILVNSEL